MKNVSQLPQKRTDFIPAFLLTIIRLFYLTKHHPSSLQRGILLFLGVQAIKKMIMASEINCLLFFFGSKEATI